jgi:aspartyl-tRNA(Asn)/glutamyl-tRNA(Gln) amidotransferase subunit A
MCLAALGSQTLGSVLRPAAFNGVVGFKPTYGRISTYGVIPLAWNFDHVGILAHCVEDVAIIFQAIAGHDTQDFRSLDIAVPDCVSNLEKSKAPHLIKLSVTRRFTFLKSTRRQKSYKDLNLPWP